MRSASPVSKPEPSGAPCRRSGQRWPASRGRSAGTPGVYVATAVLMAAAATVDSGATALAGPSHRAVRETTAQQGEPQRQEAPSGEERPRARDVGVTPGILSPGPLNAITDVGGVLVGHATLVQGRRFHTGVTAIVPHGGNVFREKVPAAIFIGNGFGKLTGISQVQELGTLETPILLTGTLNVPRVADALITWTLGLPGNEEVRSVNPVVGETNDGFLSDIRARPLGREHVFAALEAAAAGAVEEGSVGAGAGTVAFGFKGGIGTSSRRLPESVGGWTVGVLVQTNYGGVLSIEGAPVGEELGRHYLRGVVRDEASVGASGESADGSCMVVVATDAPVDHRNLTRLAARAILGLARTGTPSTNGSGDYVIAFSAHPGLRRGPDARRSGEPPATPLANDDMSPLFLATVEATEEAVYNSLFRATPVAGHRGTVEALPLEETLRILEAHGISRRDRGGR